MRFGPDDEKKAYAAIDAIVERFAAWLAERPEHERAVPSDADLALGWKLAYDDGDFGTWTRGHIDELLLDHLPRKLSASAEEAASIPASIGAFAHFLEDEGLLSDASDPADALARRALAQERAFSDAMSDPANFGMSKRMFAAAGITADNVTDEGAVQAAIARFNALPFDERGRILGLDPAPDLFDDEDDLFPDDEDPYHDDDEGMPLPVRAFPSAEELDTAAMDVPLLRRVEALREQIGADGLDVPAVDDATPADGARVYAALGPELIAASPVALVAHAVELVDGRLLRPIEAWAGMAPSIRWRLVTEAALALGAATLQLGGDDTTPEQLVDPADAAGVHLLSLLWLAEEPVAVRILRQALDELAAEAFPPRPGRHRDDKARSATVDERLADVIATWTDVGIVDVVDDRVTLTAAGAWVAAPPLVEVGYDIVEPAVVSAMSVDDLLEAMRESEEEVDALRSIWLADREPAAAAEEVVAALIDRPDPVRTLLGFTLLTAIGDAAGDAVAAARESAIGPHAQLFLAAHGMVDREDLTHDTIIRAGIELYLATSELGSPADVVETLLGDQLVGGPVPFIDDVARSDHPGAGELLELIGRHHPVKDVAKHARKAAHRWRSARGTGRERGPQRG